MNARKIAALLIIAIDLALIGTSIVGGICFAAQVNNESPSCKSPAFQAALAFDPTTTAITRTK